jgi:hypothetical protein
MEGKYKGEKVLLAKSECTTCVEKRKGLLRFVMFTLRFSYGDGTQYKVVHEELREAFVAN